MLFRWILLNAMYACSCRVVVGQTLSDTEHVLSDVFDPTVYNKLVRGQTDLSVPMNITIDIGLMSIVKVDEIQETIQLQTVIFSSWRDDRLVWNSSKYNGTSEVFVPVEMVWHPEMYAFQPISGNNRIGDLSRQLTHHYSSGLTKWTFVETPTISCSFDLTAFPWDFQTCDIYLVVWSYLKDHIQLSSSKDHIILDFYEENSAWILVSTKTFIFPNDIKSQMAYQFVIQRRPDFFVMTIFVPIILLSVLSMFVFIIPIESGERISFSLTVLLSIVLFITLVSSYIPQSAEHIPAMCFFLLFECCLCVAACVCNIISITVYYQDTKKRQPGKIRKLIVSICGRNCSKGKEVRHDDRLNRIDIKENDYDEDVENEPVKVEWVDVSRTLDLIFAVIMTLFSVVWYSMFAYYLTRGK